jgi:hypothetical protein
MHNDDRSRRLERQRRFNRYSNSNITTSYIPNNWTRGWNENNNINNNINNNVQDRYIINRGLINNRLDDLGNLEDVLIFPNNEEIEMATETIQYDISMQQTQCPISLDPFESGEEICRIRNCGHLFKKTFLMNWFERNVRCPVCRYDIRNNSTNSPRDIQNTINRYNNLPSIIRNFLTDEINQMPNTLNDFFLTFDIPLSLDISYNNY